MNRLEFFNTKAPAWDTMHQPDKVIATLQQTVAKLALRPDERLLDVGCGTGVLTSVLLDALGADGSVTALDFSPAMLEALQQKFTHEPRLCPRVGDVQDLHIAPASFDRAFCYSVWPHLPHPDQAAHHLWRALKNQGRLYIWHTASRDFINQVHTRVGGVIAQDLLEAATTLATRLEKAGFNIVDLVDNDERYWIEASKGPSP